MKLKSTARVLSLALLTACASGGTMGGASPSARDPNLITPAELATENSSNVYDAVEHLRPEMLRPHMANASSSISAPGNFAVRVYLDANPFGTIADLRTIPVSTIKQIQYLTPSQAMQRFGSGNAGGVILLSTR